MTEVILCDINLELEKSKVKIFFRKIILHYFLINIKVLEYPLKCSAPHLIWRQDSILLKREKDEKLKRKETPTRIYKWKGEKDGGADS